MDSSTQTPPLNPPMAKPGQPNIDPKQVADEMLQEALSKPQGIPNSGVPSLTPPTGANPPISNTPPTPTQPPSKFDSLKNIPKKVIFGVAALAILLTGGLGVGLYLGTQQQDTRQQAHYGSNGEKCDWCAGKDQCPGQGHATSGDTCPTTGNWCCAGYAPPPTSGGGTTTPGGDPTKCSGSSPTASACRNVKVGNACTGFAGTCVKNGGLTADGFAVCGCSPTATCAQAGGTCFDKTATATTCNLMDKTPVNGSAGCSTGQVCCDGGSGGTPIDGQPTTGSSCSTALGTINSGSYKDGSCGATGGGLTCTSSQKIRYTCNNGAVTSGCVADSSCTTSTTQPPDSNATVPDPNNGNKVQCACTVDKTCVPNYSNVDEAFTKSATYYNGQAYYPPGTTFACVDGGTNNVTVVDGANATPGTSCHNQRTYCGTGGCSGTQQQLCGADGKWGQCTVTDACAGNSSQASNVYQGATCEGLTQFSNGEPGNGKFVGCSGNLNCFCSTLTASSTVVCVTDVGNDSCGAPGNNTPTQPAPTPVPPSSNPPSSNPPGTPAPTPPSQTFVCAGIESTIAAPKIGESVTFTCEGGGTLSLIKRYQFQYKVDDGAFTRIDVSSSNNAQSISFPITKVGTYEVQCRACSDSACTKWDAI